MGCPRVSTLGWRPWPVGDVSTSRRTQTETCWLGSWAGARGVRPAHPKVAALRGLDSRRRIASCVSLVSAGSDSIVPLVLNHGGPFSPQDSSSGNSASSNSDVALYFAITDGRASPADFATGVAASSVVSSSPGQEDQLSQEDTVDSDSVEALCFEVRGDRVSPADFATAVASALVETTFLCLT